MDPWSKFIQTLQNADQSVMMDASTGRILRFGDLENEYLAIRDGTAILDRNDRGLLEIAGSDRKDWLHNLTTNHIRDLGSHEGQYAFSLNVQGRILFDLNVLMFEEHLWIDLDRRFIEQAKTHFEKYTVIEDVTVKDCSESFVRFGLCGARTMSIMESFGAPHVKVMPALGVTKIRWHDKELTLFRHDFCGSFGVEIFLPADDAETFWKDLTDSNRPISATPVGDDAIEIHRIESGIPRAGFEITDEYLPAETRQLERAVNYNKGCYLGQEVVERMRSRNVVARQLCGLQIEGDFLPSPGAELISDDGKPVGTLTSVCNSIARKSIVSLAYVKTTSLKKGTSVRISCHGDTIAAIITELPFTSIEVH